MKGDRRSFMSGIMPSGRSSVIGLALLAIAAAVILVACTKAPPPAIGMKVGERFHEIHTNKLQLKCELCHSKVIETYYDPLAQASNPADRRACLSCHKEEGVQPFYGESWDKAKVK